MSSAPTPDEEQSDPYSESDLALLTLAEVSHSDLTTVCKLCFRPAQDPEGGLKLGPLYSYEHCQAHLYCLMFSSGLEQCGEEEEGIKGFLVDDIVKEWRRGSRLKCCHCKQTYATVGCVGKGCKKSYHLPCGMESGSLQQFFGDFPSHCETHRPVQSPLVVKREARGEECGVCLEELELRPGSGLLWTPCCGGRFHRNCVERMAETAGCHFFKCPLCNNREQFSQEMQQFGIYVPDQDAEWEAGSAYDDQLERHGSCDAASCLCPDGNQYDEDDTIWEIILCSCCGAQGIHVECGQLRLTRPRWKCSFCRKVVAGLPCKPVSVFTRVRKKSSGSADNQFARNLLDNLSFKINNNEVSIGVFKNKLDMKEPAVAKFVVNSVPVCDVPLPVKVSYDEIKTETKSKTLISSDDIGKDEVDTFGVPLNVLKDDFTHVPKLKFQDSDADFLEICADDVNSVDVPLQVKVLNNDLNPETRKNIQELEAAPVDITSACMSKKSLRPNSLRMFKASPAIKIQYNTDQQGKEAVTSTPLPGSSNKKRRLTPPVGQTSILSFFQYSVSPKEMVSLTYSELKVESSAGIEVSGSESDELKHFTVQEDQNKVYACEACEMKTIFKSNFVRHLRKQHKNSFEIESTSANISNGSNISAGEVACVICNEPALPGDDYKCHLNVVHGIEDVDEVERNVKVSLDENAAISIDSDEITLEDSLLSVEEDVLREEAPCDICKAPVMMGDDYRCHLQFAHEITDTRDLDI